MQVRRPNHRLRDLLVEAGWTGQQLASAVNHAGAESGLKLSYDRTSVAHWLAGIRPRNPVAPLVTEVLARRLGRRITVEDIGLDHQPPTSERPLDLAALSRLPAGTVYSLTSLYVPAQARPAPGVDSGPALDATVVMAAETMAAMFSTHDLAFGGGSARQALAGHLSHDIAPRLHMRAAPQLRCRLMTVTTHLVYLCAFMSFDDELHGVAQRYYLTALRLATENDDAASYALTLRAMSVQALALGHVREAVHLAEAATTSGRRCEPVRQAFLYGQLAVARAADGDRHRALAVLSAAERRLEQATSQASSPVGSYHPAALAHQQALVQELLKDQAGAITALHHSIAQRPAAERRSRALLSAHQARLRLERGSLDEAIAGWHRFLDDYPHLTSGRATTALRTLRACVRPHAANAQAKALLARADLTAR